jgi:hypothetical protein
VYQGVKTFLDILGLTSFVLTGLAFLGLALCEPWLLWDTRHEPGFRSRMFVGGTKSAMYRAIKGDWPKLESAQWCRRLARAASWAMSCFMLVVLTRVIEEVVRTTR